jgi:hypothetical protein
MTMGEARSHRRVGKANGPRECAPGDVPTIVSRLKGWARRKARAFAHPT